MQKHTLGQWVYHGGFGQCVKAGLNVVAECRKPPLSPAECEANARLIAAAPKMLKALRDAVRLIEHLGGNASHQKKIIAEAENCDKSAIPRRSEPDWVTCPICQCDLSAAKSEPESEVEPNWLSMGFCSPECFSLSK